MAAAAASAAAPLLLLVAGALLPLASFLLKLVDLAILRRLHLAVLATFGDMVAVSLAVVPRYFTLLAHTVAILAAAVGVESTALSRRVRQFGLRIRPPLSAALALLAGGTSGRLLTAGGSASACIVVVFLGRGPTRREKQGRKN